MKADTRAQTAATPASMASRVKSIVGGSVGNAIEYYDWYVYSAFSFYFAPVFFPSGNPTAQLLNVAGVFAVGFFMRPVGGWILGLYADRHGRRAALLVSVVAMCLGSLTIGLLPGYASIGLLSPILLVVARLLQGLSLGGEYASSATYLSESASPSSRGFYSSFLFATLSLGQLLALVTLIVMQRYALTPEALASWGWRIPFLIGSALAVVAVWLRGSMKETASFEKRRAALRASASMRTLLRHWRECLQVAGLTLGGTVSFYAFTTYLQKYLANTVGFSKDQATLLSAAGIVFFIVIQPLFGALSDRVGRRPLLIAFGALGTCLTVPLFHWLATVGTPGGAMLPIMLALAMVGLYSSVSAIAKAELFPVEIRALGVGLPYSLTVSVFGGTAEYVALWLKDAGHESWFYWYVAACCFATLVCVVLMRDTKRHSRIEND